MGLAIGDALGTTLEFQKRDALPRVNDIVGGGPFSLQPGQWTDDTSMTLCIAASLVETGAYDPKDQLKRFIRWRDKGYMSSNGYCFDIGTQTINSLVDFEYTGKAYREDKPTSGSGNGSLMRLAPIPLAFSNDLKKAGELSADSSRTTHPSRDCLDSCFAYGQLIAGAANGATKEAMLDLASELSNQVEAPKVVEVLAGGYRTKSRTEIRSSGYVVESMEAALWAFDQSDDFEQGAILAANLAHDADTVAAIYGQLAGAHYGKSGIPSHWLEAVYAADLIEKLGLQIAARVGKFRVKKPK
ncbi:MAG: ADP-ribosylglycohydrolase family protein [Thermomicrobiales bacterium]|nr:ADP-ribosylglycohydrolase family protein [Thermomicrobiales bacterium]MCO5226288.1 ADP-ribosylglycohydrolase family protein [Thermomicrobiales bacterium]MCO5228970.1 ADP-ribosylglycohydrolase family protein [Thermomicrobiales bacterium]